MTLVVIWAHEQLLLGCGQCVFPVVVLLSSLSWSSSSVFLCLLRVPVFLVPWLVLAPVISGLVPAIFALLSLTSPFPGAGPLSCIVLVPVPPWSWCHLSSGCFPHCPRWLSQFARCPCFLVLLVPPFVLLSLCLSSPVWHQLSPVLSSWSLLVLMVTVAVLWFAFSCCWCRSCLPIVMLLWGCVGITCSHHPSGPRCLGPWLLVSPGPFPFILLPLLS